MAKNPFWLRGARGKIAGVVAQKGESGTIVRENVSPSNPRTGSQLRQRVVFATVTQAAKKMLPIIGISFEGVTKEKHNRRKFIKLNIGKFSQIARNIQAGASPAGHSWTGKNNNQLIPNAYIVSQGSLTFPNDYAITNDADDNTFIAASNTVNIPLGQYSPLQLWKSLFGAAPGSQFTVPYILTKTGTDFAMTVSSETERIADIIRYSEFHAPRIVLLNDDSTLAKITLTAQTTGAEIATFLKTAVDSEKTDVVLLDSFTSVSNYTVENNVATVVTEFGYEEDLTYGSRAMRAIALIYSEQDENLNWKYSNAVMVTNWQPISTDYPADPFTVYYGLTLDNAIDSYRTSSQRNQNYLQTGGDGGNI